LRPREEFEEEPFPKAGQNEKEIEENPFEMNRSRKRRQEKEEGPGKGVKAIGIPGEEIHEITDEEGQEAS
jgi:hypothetical protein